MDEMERYVKEQIEKGYTNEEGKPLKCQYCESTDFDEDHIYESYYVVEKIVTCKTCKNVIGHWSYGSWEL